MKRAQTQPQNNNSYLFNVLTMTTKIIGTAAVGWLGLQYLKSFTKAIAETEIDSLETVTTGRRLLTAPTVANPVPDQLINAEAEYEYFMDANEIFSGDNITFLKVTETGQPTLPSWATFEYKLVGAIDTPGVAYGIALSGNTAFIADGDSGLQVIDVSNPAAPTIIGSLDTPGRAQDIALSGNTAFIADGFAGGLQVIDVSNLSAPTIIGSRDTPGAAYGIALSGNTAFIADYYSGLQVIDVSNPTAPTIIGSRGTPGLARGIALSGNTAFIADSGSGLQVIDVSNPAAPTIIGSRDTPGHASGIALAGNTAFIADNLSGLQVIDVSNPAAPMIIGSRDTSGRAYGIALSGNTAFIADYTSGLQVIDISNLSAPTIIGSRDTPGGARAIALAGNTAFIADDSGLQVIDITQGKLSGTPTSYNLGLEYLTIQASNALFETTIDKFILAIDRIPNKEATEIPDQSLLPGETLNLILNSQLLFIDPDQAFLSLNILQLDDTPAPNWLRLAINPSLLTSRDTPGSARGIALAGNTAFIADWSSGLQVIDVSNPATPTIIGSRVTPEYAWSIALSGNTAFIADGSSGLQVIDVSNPAAPTIIGSRDTPGSARSIALAGNTAFIADWSSGLQVIDVSNPAAPTIIGSRDTPGLAFGIALSGNTAFIADGSAGLQVIDVSNPAAPTIIGSRDTPGSAYGIALSGNTAFIADGSAGLQVIDVSNPATPTIIGSIDTPGSAEGIALSGNTAFIADTVGLQVIDVSNPAAPTIIGSRDTPGFASGIALAGNTAFIANGNLGLLIIGYLNRWTLSGTPNSTHIGNYDIKITATDDLGGQAWDSFTLRVEGGPQLNGVIPPQSAKVGLPFQFFIPEGLFTDPNFDAIAYSIYEVASTSGTLLSLPNWLGFNSISSSLLGTPLTTDARNYTFQIDATDNVPGTTDASVRFDLVVDHLPAVQQIITEQITEVEVPFSYAMDPLVFVEPDGDPLIFSAGQEGGASLPTWLAFDPSTLTFSGTPTLPGEFEITVRAAESPQYYAETNFIVNVQPHFPPEVANPIPTQYAELASPFELWLGNDYFSDPNADDLTLSISLEDGSPFPDWLTFNQETNFLTGTPPRQAKKAYRDTMFTLMVAARDKNDLTAETFFDLHLQGSSYTATFIKITLPTLSALSTLFGLYAKRSKLWNLKNASGYKKHQQVLVLGDNYTYQLDTPKEHIKTICAKYKATGPCYKFFRTTLKPYPGGALLPYWLKYNAATNTLKNCEDGPTDFDLGTLTIQVINYSGEIQEQFELQVTSQSQLQGLPVRENNWLNQSAKTPNNNALSIAQTTARTGFFASRPASLAEGDINLTSVSGSESSQSSHVEAVLNTASVPAIPEQAILAEIQTADTEIEFTAPTPASW